MGAITEVSVGYSRTVNLGNYESARLEVGLTSTVVDGLDDPEQLVVALATEAKELVQARLRDAQEQRRLERQEAWYGRAARPKVDEQDGEEDDPATGVG